MRIRSTQLFFLGLITLICVNSSFAQTPLEKEPWRSIKVLVSTLKDVEKLLGAPTKIDGRTRYYDTAARERVTVWYSGEPDNSSCKWQVPDDTVVRVIVSPRKKLLLSQAGFDLTGFKELRTADGYWDYVNEEKGILINTSDSSAADKVVIFFEFSPRAKDKKKCVPTSNPSRSIRERQLRIKQSDFIPPVAQIIPELYDLYFNHESTAKKNERLKAYSKELSERRFYTGVIVSYGTRGRSDSEALNNLKFSLNNLVVTNRLQAEQLVFVDGGFKKKGMTELYLVPPGGDLPIPTSGRDVTEAVIKSL
jgi:hypothetical protein